MRRSIALAALVLALSLVPAACGSSSDGGSSDDTSSGGEAATVTLPDGWAMTDALSAEDVGTVTGQTMEVFPEASSAAQDGKPAGSYTAAGADGSKIYFGVDVQGGEAGYEKMLSFAEPGSARDVGEVGDQAATVTFSDGRSGIIVRKGDAVMRVDWDPAVYTDEAADFGARLANLLLQKMFE